MVIIEEIKLNKVRGRVEVDTNDGVNEDGCYWRRH